jgi:hypothetical protein
MGSELRERTFWQRTVEGPGPLEMRWPQEGRLGDYPTPYERLDERKD